MREFPRAFTQGWESRAKETQNVLAECWAVQNTWHVCLHAVLSNVTYEFLFLSLRKNIPVWQSKETPDNWCYSLLPVRHFGYYCTETSMIRWNARQHSVFVSSFRISNWSYTLCFCAHCLRVNGEFHKLQVLVPLVLLNPHHLILSQNKKEYFFDKIFLWY